jgi:predicted RNase H-like HicB family nuclease
VRKLEYYRLLPYTRLAEPVEEDGGQRYWVASVAELPGCKTDGDSLAEAMANLNSAFDDFIAARLEWNQAIPEPPGARAVVATTGVAHRIGEFVFLQDLFRADAGSAASGPFFAPNPDNELETTAVLQ